MEQVFLRPKVFSLSSNTEGGRGSIRAKDLVLVRGLLGGGAANITAGGHDEDTLEVLHQVISVVEAELDFA